MTVSEFEIDDVRTDAERYRLYRAGGADEPRLVLLATTPSLQGAGTAIATLAEEHVELTREAHPPIGVLDGIERRWILSPLNPAWHHYLSEAR